MDIKSNSEWGKLAARGIMDTGLKKIEEQNK
jgi:hypothetical protein